MRTSRSIEQELEDLAQLSQQTSSFTSHAYEWVSTLNEHSLLDRVYEFTKAIDKHGDRLKNDLADALKREKEEEDVSDTDARHSAE